VIIDQKDSSPGTTRQDLAKGSGLSVKGHESFQTTRSGFMSKRGLSMVSEEKRLKQMAVTKHVFIPFRNGLSIWYFIAVVQTRRFRDQVTPQSGRALSAHLLGN